ncbi:MAG: OsmC family protein [Magnetococcales bacterium]|nr:OsmC family protein [Magnetococcales bacterium]
MAGVGLPDITVTFPGGKKVDANFWQFTVNTDQPVKDGGENSAPAPFLMFLTSLGTCAGIFVLSFCQNRNLPTEGITLTQRHAFAPGEKPNSMRLATVEIDVNVPATFPEKYHGALVKVANKCAVKQVLQDPPEIVVNTVVQEE